MRVYITPPSRRRQVDLPAVSPELRAAPSPGSARDEVAPGTGAVRRGHAQVGGGRPDDCPRPAASPRALRAPAANVVRGRRRARLLLADEGYGNGLRALCQDLPACPPSRGDRGSCAAFPRPPAHVDHERGGGGHVPGGAHGPSGHSDFMTTQTYIDLAGERFRNEAERLGRRLWARIGTNFQYQIENPSPNQQDGPVAGGRNL
jgi:hypothetical protein